MILSVQIITYNHEKFIKECLDSILSQKTNFEFEIVIGVDKSTDKTLEIVKSYLKKYPKKIKLLNFKSNIGAVENHRQTYLACQGKYIAFLEGDDYWSDNKKLQIQIDYLESNPDCAITAHNVELLSNGKKKPLWTKKIKQKLEFEDLLKYGSGGATCSLVFRNKLFKDYPSWFKGKIAGDWLTQVLCAQHGYMYRFNESMGVFRRHSGGSLSNYKKQEQKDLNIDLIGLPQKYTLNLLELVDKHYKYKYKRLLSYQKAVNYFNLSKAYLGELELTHAKKYLKEFLKTQPKSFSHFNLSDWAVLLLLFTPDFFIKILFQTKRNIWTKII